MGIGSQGCGLSYRNSGPPLAELQKSALAPSDPGNLYGALEIDSEPSGATVTPTIADTNMDGRANPTGKCSTPCRLSLLPRQYRLELEVPDTNRAFSMNLDVAPGRLERLRVRLGYRPSGWLTAPLSISFLLGLALAGLAYGSSWAGLGGGIAFLSVWAGSSLESAYGRGEVLSSEQLPLVAPDGGTSPDAGFAPDGGTTPDGGITPAFGPTPDEPGVSPGVPL